MLCDGKRPASTASHRGITRSVAAQEIVRRGGSARGETLTLMKSPSALFHAMHLKQRSPPLLPRLGDHPSKSSSADTPSLMFGRDLNEFLPRVSVALTQVDGADILVVHRHNEHIVVVHERTKEHLLLLHDPRTVGRSTRSRCAASWRLKSHCSSDVLACRSSISITRLPRRPPLRIVERDRGLGS